MKTARSESTVFPIENDTVSSTMGVSVRANIVAEERTNQDGTKYTMFVYDETQYTNEEWTAMQADKANDVAYVAMMTGVEL